MDVVSTGFGILIAVVLLVAIGVLFFISRMFRKAMGQSPSQFLKSHKEERPGDA